MLNIYNFNIINLNKDNDENFLFKSKSKNVELILKKINDANCQDQHRNKSYGCS